MYLLSTRLEHALSRKESKFWQKLECGWMLFVPEGTKDTGNEISKYSIVGIFWLKKRKRRPDGLKQRDFRNGSINGKLYGMFRL